MRLDHTEGMHSRVHPTYKTKYRVANWASYDRAAIGRGDITLWVSPEAIDTWAPVGALVRGKDPGECSSRPSIVRADGA